MSLPKIEGQGPTPSPHQPPITGRNPKIRPDTVSAPAAPVTDKLETMTKDGIEPSDKVAQQAVICDHGKPKIPVADEKIIGDFLAKEVASFQKENPWLKPSFIGAYSKVLFEILELQRKTQFTEAQMEVKIRVKLFEMAKSSAELSKLITNTQAIEKMTSAISSFVTAGVQTVTAIQTVQNYGKASETVDKRIAEAKQKVVDKINEGKTNTIKAGEVIPDKIPQDTKLPSNATPKQIDKFIEDNKAAPKTAELKKMETDLDNLVKSRPESIQREVSHMDQYTNMIKDALKSTIDGATGVIQATVTLKRAVMEEEKGLLDGHMQALNKFSETTSKAQADEKAKGEKTSEILDRALQSNTQEHKLQGRG